MTRRQMVQRTYVSAGRVYKIFVLGLQTGGPLPLGDNKREFELVSLCRHLSAIPSALEFIETSKYEVGVYQWVDAVPLTDRSLGFWRSCLVFVRLTPILWQLSRRGIAHNDLMPNNVLVSQRGRVHLIDFDRAITCSRHEAFFRNFLKWRQRGSDAFFGSLAKLVRVQLGRRVPRPIRLAYRFLTGSCRTVRRSVLAALGAEPGPFRGPEER